MGTFLGVLDMGFSRQARNLAGRLGHSEFIVWCLVFSV